MDEVWTSQSVEKKILKGRNTGRKVVRNLLATLYNKDKSWMENTIP